MLRSSVAEQIFIGNGEAAALMRNKDWAATPLGPCESWPEALKAALRILLASRFPMWLGWGPDVVLFYNDAYRPTLGTKHPHAIGRPAREVWAEAWPELEPRIRTVYGRGEASWDRALQLVLHRSGHAEETYHTFSCSPLLGDGGHVEGLFCADFEETDRVIGERRLESLRLLASALSAAEGRASALEAVCSSLAANQHDLPFVLLYLFAEEQAHLACAGGFALPHPAAPQTLPLDAVEPWPLRRHDAVVDLSCLRDLPRGVWSASPSRAAVIPIGAYGGARLFGAMVAGLSPHRRFDAEYRTFLDLLAAQIGSGLASAEAYDSARRSAAALAEAARLREEAASALRELNQRLATQVAQRTHERDMVWRTSRDLLVISDLAGHLRSVNPACNEALGYTEDELLGLDFERLLHEEDRPMLREQRRRLERGEVVRDVDLRLRKKDGGYCWYSWQCVPEGKHFYGAGRDINDRKQLEEQLRRSQRLEALGQLTGGVAHDFNNLLQVISGNLQLLAKDVAGSERAERRVQNALAGVSRGARLAAQLLAFGRRQALEPKVVNIGRFIGGMEDMLRRALGEEIELETVVSGGLWNTLVDPGQAENALLNLAINARDAMDGRGRLTIEARNALLDDNCRLFDRDITPGQYVMLAVSDTGCGMPPEVLDKVFEPFYSTKPEGKGTGLGLSMVYGFVKQSGGHLKLHSELGRGTTVELYLPRAYEAEDTRDDGLDRDAGVGRETILVVEDDEEVRETAAALLADLGYRVCRARDAESGLRLIDGGLQPDLLFTDVIMPGALRSPDFARLAVERVPNLAVLFTSGYTENAIVHGGRLDPGLELLPKPYTREALARKIRHVLHNQRLRHAAPTAVGAAPPAVPLRDALRVLLVEDDALIRGIAAETLIEAGHAVWDVENASGALQALQQSSFDLMITDLGLPDMPGAELVRRALEASPNLHVIAATGQDSLEGEHGLENVVLLVKPYGQTELLEAIRRP